MKPKLIPLPVYLVAAVGVVIMVILIIVAIFNSRSAARNAKRASEAVATVTDTRAIFSSYNNRSLSVKYKYTVDGQRYQGETLKGTNSSWSAFIVGKTAKACYNPTDPADSAVWPMDYTCGH